ncbi:hypothetical protein J6590_077261 [Homalodisca vitripennis]|nr:hypothetical protein J6590_077261 [Homalodisca vitripennis]
MFQASRGKVEMMNGGDKLNTVWRVCCHSACTMLWADNACHVQTRGNLTDQPKAILQMHSPIWLLAPQERCLAFWTRRPE